MFIISQLLAEKLYRSVKDFVFMLRVLGIIRQCLVKDVRVGNGMPMKRGKFQS